MENGLPFPADWNKAETGWGANPQGKKAQAKEYKLLTPPKGNCS